MFNVLAIGWKIIEFFTISLLKCCDLCKDDTSCLYSLDENSIIYHIYFWEQRKLNEYLEVSRAKNKDEVFGKEDVLSVSGDYGIVNQIEFQGRSFAGVSVAPYGVVETGDVVYTKSPLKSNPYGIIKTNKGKPGIVSTLYAVYKPQDNVYSEFVQIYFEQDARMNNYMHPLVNKGAKNDMKVSDENALKGEVCFPNRDEQIKISEYFAKLDHLITLHQHKRNKVSYVKSTFSTLFWEQRKFSDLVQIERGGSPRPIDDFITDAPNGLNWVKIGDTPTQGNYITKTTEKIRPEGLPKTREVHPGDLILSNSMSFGKPYIMGIDGCIHDGWLLIRNIYGVFDLTFLCHLLGTSQMLSQYRSLAAGSTVNNLNKELVGNTVVTIPSITEQRLLGDYLEQLDNLITLHQRKMKYILKEVFIWIILIKRVVLKKPLSLSYRIMVGRKRLLSILQNRI